MSTEENNFMLPHHIRQAGKDKSTPGIIHFDVSGGCIVELLNGALLDLGLPIEVVFHAFKQLGIAHILPMHCTEQSGPMMGSYLDLVHESGQSLYACATNTKRVKINGSIKRKQSMHWEHVTQEYGINEPVSLPDSTFVSNEEVEHYQSNAAIINAWLRDEKGSLNDLLLHIRSSQLAPIPSALVQKTLELLRSSLKKAYGNHIANLQLDGLHLVQILCQVTAFCVLIHALDPLEVSATRIPLSWSPVFLQHNKSELDEHSWVLALVEELPTYEQEWPAPFAEPVAVALLKSIAARFGARGECRLLQSGIGVCKNLKEIRLITRALWCEPAVVSTRSIEGPSAKPRVFPSKQLQCVLGQGVETQDLIRRLLSLGARSIATSQVMEQGVRPKTMIQLNVSHNDIEKVIEALLVTGEASEISTTLSEKYELLSRIVSVPFGRKQKKLQCSVVEWLWCGKILRAEPLASDLASIVATTGFAQEAIRSDVLSAWKKWRREE